MPDYNETVPEKPGKRGAPAEGADRPTETVTAHHAPRARTDSQRAARVIDDLTRRVVEQGRPVTPPESTAPTTDEVAGNLYEQGRRALEAAGQITGCYLEAADDAAGELQALRACSSELVRGTQRVQQAWLKAVQQSFERIGRTPEAFLSCGSAIEVARVQGDLYTNMVSSMASCTATMLQAMAEVSQQAGRTLHQASRRE